MRLMPMQTRTASRSRAQLAVALGAGVLVGLVVVATSLREYAPLAGWDTLAVVYLLTVWRAVRRTDAKRTAELAAAENPDRASADALLLGAAVASLVVVGFFLAIAKHTSPRQAALQAAVAVLSVTLSWVLVHAVHTLVYARLYYAHDDAGVSFNTEEPPCYGDFAYLAFTIGMTFQVSDTALRTAAFRRTALRHALLSYLFGAVVLATLINLIVGLGG